MYVFVFLLYYLSTQLQIYPWPYLFELYGQEKDLISKSHKQRSRLNSVPLHFVRIFLYIKCFTNTFWMAIFSKIEIKTLYKQIIHRVTHLASVWSFPCKMAWKLLILDSSKCNAYGKSFHISKIDVYCIMTVWEKNPFPFWLEVICS